MIARRGGLLVAGWCATIAVTMVSTTAGAYETTQPAASADRALQADQLLIPDDVNYPRSAPVGAITPAMGGPSPERGGEWFLVVDEDRATDEMIERAVAFPEQLPAKAAGSGTSYPIDPICRRVSWSKVWVRDAPANWAFAIAYNGNRATLIKRYRHLNDQGGVAYWDYGSQIYTPAGVKNGWMEHEGILNAC